MRIHFSSTQPSLFYTTESGKEVLRNPSHHFVRPLNNLNPPPSSTNSQQAPAQSAIKYELQNLHHHHNSSGFNGPPSIDNGDSWDTLIRRKNPSNLYSEKSFQRRG